MLYFTILSFTALMVYAAYSDLKSYTLPNFISILLVIGFALIALLVQPPLAAIGWHLVVAIAFFAIGFTLFATNQFGGGDVKVIAALGLWFGPNNAVAFLVTMALIGGVLAVLLLLFRRMPLPAGMSSNQSLRDLHDPKNGIPYGVAISIAAITEFPNTQIYAALVNL